jgi:uncharacterized protein
MKAMELSQQQYINLETFRKSGAGVKTPVWFVVDGESVFVRTVASSGKVKRIRNFSNVNIAPCKSDGALLGEWAPAQAREVRDEQIERKVDQMLDKKYGLLKKMFSLTSSIRGWKYTLVEIRPVE